jgi:hypothetical protein
MFLFAVLLIAGMIVSGLANMSLAVWAVIR